MEQSLPTHINKETGDIVFWGDHLDPNLHEELPKDYHETTHAEASRMGDEKTLREQKFKGWTIEELGVYFEDKLKELSK